MYHTPARRARPIWRASFPEPRSWSTCRRRDSVSAATPSSARVFVEWSARTASWRPAQCAYHIGAVSSCGCLVLTVPPRVVRQLGELRAAAWRPYNRDLPLAAFGPELAMFGAIARSTRAFAIPRCGKRLQAHRRRLPRREKALFSPTRLSNFRSVITDCLANKPSGCKQLLCRSKGRLGEAAHLAHQNFRGRINPDRLVLVGDFSG